MGNKGVGMRFACCSRWTSCIVLGYCCWDDIEDVEQRMRECTLGKKLFINGDDDFGASFRKQLIKINQSELDDRIRLHYNEKVDEWFDEKYLGGDVIE
jgi:hypothetical protein